MSDAKTIVLLGSSGTIGSAVHSELLRHGHNVIVFTRDHPRPSDHDVKVVDFSRIASIRDDGFGIDPVDAVISCMASRTGAPKDAWAVDYQAHSNVLAAAKAKGVNQFVLLSAICVQKPLLAFQEAKLAFENELETSGLTFSIVRPTAFFKSLSGQLDRLRAGKKFLLFGTGELTACKPISDADLARFMVSCLTDPDKQNKILPIGGPGPALSPKQQGELLFEALGEAPRFSKVPVGMMDAIIGVLSTLGWIIPPLKQKAELAKIGKYYATESMLVWDEAAGRYDADATPEFGSDRLSDHYQKLVAQGTSDQRGDHKVF